MTNEPEATATVQWGSSDRPGRFTATLAGLRWRAPVTWGLTGLGGLALFGSLVAEWQTMPADQGTMAGDDGAGGMTIGVGLMFVWGTAWVLGAMVLSASVGLVLLGPPAVRAAVRAVGFAAAGVMLLFMVAASINLAQESLFRLGPEQDLGVGRGPQLALVTVLLFGGALWLAHRTGDPVADLDGDGRDADGSPHGGQRRGAPEEPVHDGPHDLSVGPAEPDTLQG